MAVTFGIRLPHSGPLATPEAIRRVGVEAETLGFDSVWVHDHISYGRDWVGHRASGLLEQITPGYEPAFYESVTVLTYVAGFTERIKLGTSVLILPLRNPLVLGRQLLTLQALSRGRLIVGVGVGDYPAEFRALNIPYGERGRITDDYLEVLRKTFQGGLVTHYGPYIKCEEAWFFPGVQPPPIFVAGGVVAVPEPEEDCLVPAVLERVARWADGWMPDWGSPALIEEGVRRIAERRARHRQGAEHFQVAMTTVLFMCDTDEEARHRTARSVRGAEQEANVVASFGTRSAQKYYAKSLIGSPATVARKVGRYAEAGVDTFILKCLASDLDSFVSMMRRFRREVAAALRGPGSEPGRP